MKPFYLIILFVLFTGCVKDYISPISTKTTSTIKTDTVKSITYSDTDTSNPEYWFNGSKGTALVRVICKDCDAIATIGNDTRPFLFNSDGVGYLKYTPAAGLSIYIAVCPGSTKEIKADIFDAKNLPLFNYSGVNTSNWIYTFVIK